MLICDWDHEPHMMGDDGDVRRTVIGRGPDLKNPQRHQSSVIVVLLLGFGPVHCGNTCTCLNESLDLIR